MLCEICKIKNLITNNIFIIIIYIKYFFKYLTNE